MKERIQKILSARGLCSRREAERWIAAGRVSVNGRTAALGEQADPETDEIAVDGTMLPRLIRWMNGRVFAIEQLGYKCRASSAKVGGGGIRYTVRINGRETYLFQEGSRWFVEARA